MRQIKCIFTPSFLYDILIQFFRTQITVSKHCYYFLYKQQTIQNIKCYSLKKTVSTSEYL